VGDEDIFFDGAAGAYGYTFSNRERNFASYFERSRMAAAAAGCALMDWCWDYVAVLYSNGNHHHVVECERGLEC